MAMNKKEQAALEQALTLAALRATSGSEPDVMPPSSFSEHSVGFSYCGESSYSPRVESAWSTSISHGTGDPKRNGSQNARRLFSTKLLALQALRRAVELECCRRLRSIDRMIEEEEAAKLRAKAGEE